MDLAPPGLLQRVFYQEETAALERLQADLDAATAKVEEYTEENGGDEGLLSEVVNDKGKVIKTTARSRLQGLDSEDDEERSAVEQVLALVEAETSATTAVKKARTSLDSLVLAKYAELGEDEIRKVVVDDKWSSSLESSITSEIVSVGASLSRRIKVVEERYAEPLPSLEESVSKSGDAVEQHLKRMGLEW